MAHMPSTTTTTTTDRAESAYAAIASEAARLKLPEHYHADLTTHDRRFIGEHPGTPFLWMPYDCGTHLVMLTAGIPGQGSTAGMLNAILSVFGYKIFHIYHWNGRRLVGVNRAQAQSIAGGAA